MSHQSSRLLMLISIAALLGAACLGGAPARADGSDTYMVSGDDGYGIADCMKQGSECGRVIADSWCESHGHAHALTFGLGQDVTGSSTARNSPMIKIAAGDVVIRCGD